MSKNRKKGNIILLENLQIFEDSLSTFTLDTPLDKNGWSFFEIKSEVGIDVNCKVSKQSTWVVWYKENHKISITSIRKKIMNLLEANKHFANDEICDIFLATFSMFSDIKNLLLKE